MAKKTDNKKRGNQFSNGPNTKCPHCGSRANNIATKQVTAIYREARYQCQNADCGAMFLATISVDKMLHPSRTPNPDVQIPMADFGQGQTLTPAKVEKR